MKTRLLISTFAAAALCASASLAQSAAPNPQPDVPAFPDVPRNHWAYDAVYKLAAAGIIEGRPAAARTAAPRVSQSAPVAVLSPMFVTPRIKTALGANPALAGSTINVSTTFNSHRVILQGVTRNAAQKQLVGAVAKQNAPGYTIVNQLKVVPTRAVAPRVGAVAAKRSITAQRSVASVATAKQLRLRNGVLIHNAHITQFRNPNLTKIEGSVRSQRELNAALSLPQTGKGRVVYNLRVVAAPC